MDDIQLYISEETVLRLKFLDAVHPALVHPKAEHWQFIYQLYQGNRLFDHGLFAPIYFISGERQMLIIQEYHSSILDKDSIKTDDDVLFNLRLFDFSKAGTGRFSKLTGGSFKIETLAGSSLVFQKQYQDLTKMFEIDLDKITMVAITAP